MNREPFAVSLIVHNINYNILRHVSLSFDILVIVNTLQAGLYVLVIPWPSCCLKGFIPPGYKSLKTTARPWYEWFILCYYGFCCDLHDCITS